MFGTVAKDEVEQEKIKLKTITSNLEQKEKATITSIGHWFAILHNTHQDCGDKIGKKSYMSGAAELYRHQVKNDTGVGSKTKQREGKEQGTDM